MWRGGGARPQRRRRARPCTALWRCTEQIGARESLGGRCGVPERPRGAFYRARAVHDGRGLRRRPWRVHGDQFGDYTATVQRLVVAWGLTGSGKLLESSRRTVRVGELRGGRILPAPSKCSTAVSGEPRRNGDGRGARFLPCGCREVQGCRGEGERGQGGPGGEENGDDGEGDTAMTSGLRSMTSLQKTPSFLFSFLF